MIPSNFKTKTFFLMLLMPSVYVFLKLLNYFLNIFPDNVMRAKGIIVYSCVLLFFITLALGIIDLKRWARITAALFIVVVAAGYITFCCYYEFFWSWMVTTSIPLVFFVPGLYYLMRPSSRTLFR